MKKWILVVSLFAAVPAYAATAEPESIQRIKQEIIQLLGKFTFQLNRELQKDLKFCEKFFREFQSQSGIVHLQPLFEVNDFTAPSLEPYKKKCPELKLNETIADQFGNPAYGSKHFRLYHVDINNKKSDGTEFVFYHDTFVTKTHLEAENLPGASGPTPAYGGGEYRIIDFNNCTINQIIPVDQGGGITKDLSTYTGVINYKGSQFIFDVSPLGDGRLYLLDLWAYRSEKAKMAPVCHGNFGVAAAK